MPHFVGNKSAEEIKLDIIELTWKCLNDHETNVQTIVQTVNSQYSAVSILLGLLQSVELNTDAEVDKQEQFKSGLMQKCRACISSTENTLILQSDYLTKSFTELQTCLKDYIINTFPEFAFNKYDGTDKKKLFPMTICTDKTHQSRIDELEEKVNADKDEIKQQCVTIENKELKIRELECNIEAYLENINSLVVEKKKLNETITEKESQIARKQIEIDNSQCYINNLVDDIILQISELNCMVKTETAGTGESKQHSTEKTIEQGDITDQWSDQMFRLKVELVNLKCNIKNQVHNLVNSLQLTHELESKFKLKDDKILLLEKEIDHQKEMESNHLAEMDKLKHCIKNKEIGIVDLEKHCCQLNNNIMEREIKIQNCTDELARLSESMTETVKVTEYQTELISGQEDKIEELKSENEKKCREIRHLEKEVSSLKISRTEQVGEIEKLMSKNEDLENAQEQLNEQLRSVTTHRDLLNEQLKAVSLRKLRIRVQLYNPGNKPNNIARELHAMLLPYLEQEGIALDLTECESASKVQPDVPAIVICVNASRLGTDVTNCLHNVKLSSRILVLVLHHKDIHALPNQRSDKMLTGDLFKSIGGIIDMAFLSDRGLYLCAMNTEAVRSIAKFVHAHIPK